MNRHERVGGMSGIVPAGQQAQSDRWRFTPGMRVAGLLFCSGQVGVDADNALAADPEEQFEQAFRNVDEVLRAAGGSWADVVEMSTFHVGLRRHLPTFSTVRDRWISAPWPSWTAVGVSELGSPDALVEIKVVALVDPVKPDVGPDAAGGADVVHREEM